MICVTFLGWIFDPQTNAINRLVVGAGLCLDFVLRRGEVRWLATAFASCAPPTAVCVYVDIVKLMSECRMIDWATLGWQPVAANNDPVVCRSEWKSR